MMDDYILKFLNYGLWNFFFQIPRAPVAEKFGLRNVGLGFSFEPVFENLGSSQYFQ